MTYLKMELLTKKEAELKDLKNSQTSHAAKNKKENTKGVAKQLFDMEIRRDLNYGLH